MSITRISETQRANAGDILMARVLLMGCDMDIKEAARKAHGGEFLGVMLGKILLDLVPKKTAYRITAIEYNGELVGFDFTKEEGNA